MSQFDVKSVAYTLTDPGESGKLIPLFPAPAAAIGGGITIRAAWAMNGTVTTGGTAHKLSLVNGGSSGTVAGGTIAAAIGGTADHWVEKTPKAFTISSTYQYVAGGEWVCAYYEEVGGGTFTNPASVTVEYVMGN